MSDTIPSPPPFADAPQADGFYYGLIWSDIADTLIQSVTREIEMEMEALEWWNRLADAMHAEQIASGGHDTDEDYARCFAFVHSERRRLAALADKIHADLWRAYGCLGHPPHEFDHRAALRKHGY